MLDRHNPCKGKNLCKGSSTERPALLRRNARIPLQGSWRAWIYATTLPTKCWLQVTFDGMQIVCRFYFSDVFPCQRQAVTCIFALVLARPRETKNCTMITPRDKDCFAEDAPIRTLLLLSWGRRPLVAEWQSTGLCRLGRQ